jgi:hypothetical protein
VFEPGEGNTEIRKKSQCKEKWMHKIQESISARWTERHKKYIQAGIDEEAQAQADRLPSMQLEKEHEQIERNCRHDMFVCEKEVYKTVAEASHNEEFDALLLPSMSTSTSPLDSSDDVAANIGVSGVARVYFNNKIRLEREKRIKAVQEAQAYRNMAETMRREKRQIVNTMNEKIEVVRDFWRNNIKEGSSRAGIMVRRALLGKNLSRV